VSSRKAYLPNIPMVMTVLTWGFNFVALKILYGHMSAPAVSVVRFVAMYGMLVAVCKIRRESLRYERRDVWPLLLLGFVSMGAYMVLFLEGMRGADPAEGAIIISTAPIFTTIFAVIFRQEQFSVGALIGAIVAFGGTVVVILGGNKVESGHIVASVLLLAASVVWAYGTMLMRPLMQRYSPTQALTLSMPGGLIVLLPYGIRETFTMDWAEMTWQTWAMLAHISVLAGVVGFLGFYAGVRQIGAAGAMMYQFFVPPTAAFFAWVLLGKTLTIEQSLGLIVVIGGVALASRSRLLAARAASSTA
jgi:drug/metabolite transporter (DMT)-like permease